MTEPLTPEARLAALLRSAMTSALLDAGYDPDRWPGAAEDDITLGVVRRLLAAGVTFAAARQPAPEAGLLTRDRAALAATPTPDPEANRVADTPCAHERITTASADGLPSLWYCDDCRRRFYPACETCVDIGHRRETHVQPAPESGGPAATLAWTLASLGDHYIVGQDDGTGLLVCPPAAHLAWLSEDDRLAGR